MFKYYGRNWNDHVWYCSSRGVIQWSPNTPSPPRSPGAITPLSSYFYVGMWLLSNSSSVGTRNTQRLRLCHIYHLHK